MPKERYLFCRFCKEVHHITPFDRAPVYLFDNAKVVEIAADDQQDFLDRHADHRIEELESIAESFFRGSSFDPMKVAYFWVTNGEEEFEIKAFRKSVAEPLRHEVLPRQLNFWEGAVNGRGRGTGRR